MTDPEKRGLPELSLSVIEDLKAKGFTQAEIARMYGVSRQAISKHKTKYGGKLSPREEVKTLFPWDVPVLYNTASPCLRLRDHAEYMATGGKGMKEYKLERLRWFYRKLKDENVVVEFDPNIPPDPGVSKNGGWAYRERTPEDGDLIIRVNEIARPLTDKSRRIWRLPPTEP